jgi:hypothetical protein
MYLFLFLTAIGTSKQKDFQLVHPFCRQLERQGQYGSCRQTLIIFACLFMLMGNALRIKPNNG